MRSRAASRRRNSCLAAPDGRPGRKARSGSARPRATTARRTARRRRARQNRIARPTSRVPPVFSSAKLAMASNPRYDNTAMETAPTTAEMSKPLMPNGESSGRAGPAVKSTISPMPTKTAKTQSSAISTTRPARAATPNARQVERGCRGERQDRERPGGDRRRQRVQCDPRKKERDRRDQQVVEHRQPPGEKSREPAEPFGGIGKDRTCVRHHARHLGVRPGGERHGDGRREVDEGGRAVGLRVEDAEDADRRQRADEEQPVDDEIAERERAAKRGCGRHVSRAGSLLTGEVRAALLEKRRDAFTKIGASVA